MSGAGRQTTRRSSSRVHRDTSAGDSRPALLDAGCEIRCLVRTPAKLDDVTWRERVECVAGSVGGDLTEAVLWYRHRRVPRAFHRSGVALGTHGGARRPQLCPPRCSCWAAPNRLLRWPGKRQRHPERPPAQPSRVGHALASTGVDVVELRGGVVIGAGSASFEMLRYLVDVLPIMVTPRWITTRCQPIAISDVLELLVQAITDSRVPAGVYEVGGPDVVTYAEMMALYAQVAGLPRRRLIKVPVLTPRLSSHWVGLVTPVPVRLARELVESLVNEVVVTDRRSADIFSNKPLALADAIGRSLATTRSGEVPTSFVDADLLPFAPATTDPTWSGGTVLTDIRAARCSAEPARAFSVVVSVGGDKGWYSGRRLWQIRGLIDQLVGGPGLRRGRRDPVNLGIGDPVDFWRVEALIPERMLRLRAEMRLPGTAWLTWELSSSAGAGTCITQTAEFRPRGLLGRFYWLAVAPFHRFVFQGLLAGILAEAESVGREIHPCCSPPKFSTHSCLLDGGTAEGAGQRGAKHARGTRQRWSLIGDASRHLVPARSATGRSARARVRR